VQFGPGQAQHRQERARRPYAVDDGRRLLTVANTAVVEGAVRLDVGHGGPGGAREDLQGADLVGHLGGQVLGGHVHAAAAEPGQVAVGDLGPDTYALGGGPLADAAHGDGVARVEAAGDVGAGDGGQEGVVVGEPPPSEALSQVGVEVDHRQPT
jgi:hypothetical protein